MPLPQVTDPTDPTAPPLPGAAWRPARSGPSESITGDGRGCHGVPSPPAALR